MINKFSNIHKPLFNRAYKHISPIIQSKKAASYFTLTLSLFTLSFFGIFAIRPTLITAITLTKKVTDLKRLYAEYEDKIGNLIRAQSEYEQIRNDIVNIEKALPINAHFSKLAKSLEKFAQREDFSISQLQIENVPISNPLTTGKLYNFGFSLVGVGTYSSVASFLSHIINWQRIVNIKSLEFAQAGGTTSATIRLTLKAITFYEP